MQRLLERPGFREQCLRAHSPGAGTTARLGAVAFIHRFGSTRNSHLHFHCVIIDGMFDTTAAGELVTAVAGSSPSCVRIRAATIPRWRLTPSN